MQAVLSMTSKLWVNSQARGNSQLWTVIVELDVEPQRDDDAFPMSTYRCMLRPT